MSKNTVKSDIARALLLAINELDKSGGENDRQLSDRLDAIKNGLDDGDIVILDHRYNEKKGKKP